MQPSSLKCKNTPLECRGTPTLNSLESTYPKALFTKEHNDQIQHQTSQVYADKVGYNSSQV